MLKLDESTKQQLLELHRTKRIMLEGNILKLIDAGDDDEFANYINDAIEKDKEIRRKRLEITRQVQSQNVDLVKWKQESELAQEKLTESLHELERSKEAAELARQEAENAKAIVENDLDLMQKRSQFALIGTIIKVALAVIIGVGLSTTALYTIAIINGYDTQIIGSTWSNMFGILLTNAFSIVGTIMGVKYASEKNNVS
jgi:transcription initiation factor TFIIIB Brf1 subunit/transcription initiation factor TFIIB